MTKKTSKHVKPMVLASMAGLAMGGSAHAQTSAAGEETPEEEIIVTARQRDEALIDVPIAVTVLTEDTIEEAGISRVADYSQLIPNVIYDNSLNLGQNFFIIRGMTQVQYAPPPVAVMVDGVLQISPYQFNVEGLDLAQIEVLKGPQGAIYGRNAIGGAINIATRRPGDTFEGSVRAGYGRGDEASAGASLSGPIIDGRLGFTASVSHDDRGGGQIVNQTTGLNIDTYEDTSARLRLLFEPSTDWEFDLNYRHSDTEGPDPTQILNLTGDPHDMSFRYTSNTVGNNSRELQEFSTRALWRTPVGELALTLAYVDVFEDLYTDFDFTADDLINAAQSFDNDGFSQELRFTSDSDHRLRWILGAYHVVLNNVTATTAFADLNADLVADDVLQQLADDNETENYAFFGQVAYDVVPALELAVALRYDHDEFAQTTTVIEPPFGAFPAEISFDELQPKFTTRYSVSDDASLYASWGRGYRNGGFNSVLASQRIFRPEVAETIELGVKGNFLDDTVYIDIALFHTDLTDAQFVFLNSATFTNETTNINQVEIQGFEASTVWRVTDQLSLNAAVGVADTEIGEYTPDPTATGNRVPKTPEYTLNLGFSYDWTLAGDWEGVLRVDYQRQGQFYWDVANTLDREPINLLNARLSIGQDKGIFAAVWGRNLLDEIYPLDYVPIEFTAHPLGLDVYQRSIGATYGVEIGYRF